MKKTKSGISLIVLVITILVLSILAATVIISVSNTNVIEEANKTVFKSDLSNYKEVFEMYVTTETMKNNSFDSSSLDGTYQTNEDTFNKIFGKVESKYQEGLKIQDGKLVYETEDETEKAIVDSLGMGMAVDPTAGVTIPDGFYYVGGTKTTGLVISDNATDENKGVDYTCVGNQFVWVPVDYTATGTKDSNGLDTGFTAVFKRGSGNSTTNTMTGTLSTSYTEPYAIGYSTEKAEYYAMMESVQKYGGFYIARFEAGDSSATSARTSSSGVGTVVSKKGAYVYNYVKWGDSMTSIGTTGAVYLSQQMYAKSSSVVSTLCYGVQWDAALNFVADADHSITDSRSWGNHSNSTGDAETNSGSLQKTGANEAWKAKNIYDLAGNAREWTMEAYYSYGRVYRGCSYLNGSSVPASYRGAVYNPNSSADDVGFRPALYIVVE